MVVVYASDKIRVDATASVAILIMWHIETVVIIGRSGSKIPSQYDVYLLRC